MCSARCGVEGCTATVRWALKDQQADADLHTFLCQEHWAELHRHAWVIAMTGYDLIPTAVVASAAQMAEVNK